MDGVDEGAGALPRGACTALIVDDGGERGDARRASERNSRMRRR